MGRSRTPAGYNEAAPSSSRPPTKKSKRPRQSEPEPEVNYNSRIFTSKAAEDRYDILVQRSPIFERGLKVSPSTPIGGQIHNTIEGFSWRKFCATPEHKANVTLMYEFYANLLDQVDDVVTVRGVEVDCSVGAINALLGTPDIDFENEGYRQWLRDPNLDEMLSLLTTPGENWVMDRGVRKLLRKSLTRLNFSSFVCVLLSIACFQYNGVYFTGSQKRGFISFALVSFR